MKHFDSSRGWERLGLNCRLLNLERNRDSFQWQVFLPMHPTPFKDEIGTEVVGQATLAIYVPACEQAEMTWVRRT
jgi:hypothetical protein